MARNVHVTKATWSPTFTPLLIPINTSEHTVDATTLTRTLPTDPLIINLISIAHSYPFSLFGKCWSGRDHRRVRRGVRHGNTGGAIP